MYLFASRSARLCHRHEQLPQLRHSSLQRKGLQALRTPGWRIHPLAQQRGPRCRPRHHPTDSSAVCPRQPHDRLRVPRQWLAPAIPDQLLHVRLITGRSGFAGWSVLQGIAPHRDRSCRLLQPQRGGGNGRSTGEEACRLTQGVLRQVF